MQTLAVTWLMSLALEPPGGGVKALGPRERDHQLGRDQVGGHEEEGREEEKEEEEEEAPSSHFLLRTRSPSCTSSSFVLCLCVS